MINPLSFRVFICVTQTLITHQQGRHCMSSGDKNRMMRKSFLLMMNTSVFIPFNSSFPSKKTKGKVPKSTQRAQLEILTKRKEQETFFHWKEANKRQEEYIWVLRMRRMCQREWMKRKRKERDQERDDCKSDSQTGFEFHLNHKCCFFIFFFASCPPSLHPND